jgi:hypothetical protein
MDYHSPQLAESHNHHFALNDEHCSAKHAQVVGAYQILKQESLQNHFHPICSSSQLYFSPCFLKLHLPESVSNGRNHPCDHLEHFLEQDILRSLSLNQHVQNNALLLSLLQEEQMHLYVS